MGEGVSRKQPLLPEVEAREPLQPFDQEICREISRIGFHPFILVRLEEVHDAFPRFIVCKTQNDAAAFVNELSRIPDFASSLLVRGIERALQLEIYEAADLLYSWVKATDLNSEQAYLGLPADLELASYYGYPVFGLVPP